jgi:O-antigen/teichoic acid export membrane protein
MMCAGKESYLMIAYTVTMVLNFINNLILIPRFGALGASIASLISEIVVFGLVLASSRKYQNYRINMKNLIASAVASVIMFAVVFGFQAVFKGSVIRLLGGTVVGAFVFVMINAAFKNDFMAKIVRIVYRKLKL